MAAALRLVLIDDDAAEANLVLRAVRASGRAIDVQTAESVGDALVCLDAAKAPAKTLILLDLNLVTHDGRDVLRALAERQRLGDLAVVVFTNSDRSEDITECYRLGAKSFLQKPSTYPGLKATLAELFEYWFDVVELPLAS